MIFLSKKWEPSMKQNNLRSLWTVIKFTAKDLIGRKAFRVSTIIILLLIAVGFNIPNLISTMNGNSFKNTILISDQNNIFENSLNTLPSADMPYNIELSNDDFDTIKSKIDSGDIDTAILIEKSDQQIKLRHLVNNTATITTLPEDLLAAMNLLYTQVQIQKLGLTADQISSIVPNFEFSVEQTGDDIIGGDIFVMMMLSCVLFFAIYFCVYQVSSSITTEKTSKIIETLVTSTSPRTIVLGKTIGIGLVGLAQITLFVVTAIICANVFLEPEVLAAMLDVSSLTPLLGVMTIIYFLLGYFAYALLYALTGSTVSKPEDIQSANTPIALLTVFSFYFAYFTLTDPTSNLNIFAAIFPFSSPFCMPLRLMMGIASGWEITISIAVLIITCIIVANIAIKIYSNAILNYGTKMSLLKALKTYKTK